MSTVQSASPVNEGDIVAGKYRVERILGMGGMGVVVAAMHLELDQRVALKFLLPQAVANPEVAKRFGREARAAARIRCEHVARVIDVGSMPDGSPFMVMEYMQGEDLEGVLRRLGPLPVDVATNYVLQACEAIAEAHALGIVHRDLKPANLFLAERPSGAPIVKVLDFGISKSTLSTSEAQLTKTSAILGSPLYMSPEQMTTPKLVDVRSDIWALGVVLYELLVGRTVFPADTMPELIAAILARTHDPIKTVRNDIDPGLEAAVAKCLEKDAARRFANVAEFARAIAPFGPPRSEQSVERISHVLGVDASGTSARDSASGAAPMPAPLSSRKGMSGTNAPLARSLADGSIPGVKPLRTWLVVPGVLAVVATLALVGVFGVGLRTGATTVAAGSPLASAAAPGTNPPAVASVATSQATPAVAAPTVDASSALRPLEPSAPGPSPALTAKHPALAPAPAIAGRPPTPRAAASTEPSPRPASTDKPPPAPAQPQVSRDFN